MNRPRRRRMRASRLRHRQERRLSKVAVRLQSTRRAPEPSFQVARRKVTAGKPTSQRRSHMPQPANSSPARPGSKSSSSWLDATGWLRVPVAGTSSEADQKIMVDAGPHPSCIGTFDRWHPLQIVQIGRRHLDGDGRRSPLPDRLRECQMRTGQQAVPGDRSNDLRGRLPTPATCRCGPRSSRHRAGWRRTGHRRRPPRCRTRSRPSRGPRS